MTQASSNKDKKITLQIPKKWREWKDKLLSYQDKTIAKRQIWDKAKQAKPRRNKPGRKKWVNEVGNTLALLYAFVFLFFFLCVGLIIYICLCFVLVLENGLCFCLCFHLAEDRPKTKDTNIKTKTNATQYKDKTTIYNTKANGLDIPQHNRVRRQCTP